MKKWLMILSVVVIITVGVLINIYFKAVGPLKEAQEQAVHKAKTEAGIVSVDEVYVYNGSETSYAVTGINNQKEEIVVFIPEKAGNIIVKKANEGITKNQAIQIVQQEKHPQKIVSVRLGMEKQVPLWEVHYVSEKSKLNYYYIDYKTGEWLKKIENL